MRMRNDLIGKIYMVHSCSDGLVLDGWVKVKFSFGSMDENLCINDWCVGVVLCIGWSEMDGKPFKVSCSCG